MIKKFSFILSLLIIVGAVVYGINSTNKVHAGQTLDRITGYAWSTNVGWIRMNCENTASDNTCSTAKYGVVADHDTGTLSGFAWSSVLGWISFNETDGCPVLSGSSMGYSHYNDNKDCQPRALFSYGSGGAYIVGWARVVNSGEWISLNCLNSSNGSNTNGYCGSSNHKVSYPDDGGPSLNKDGGPLGGYAYGSGGANVGWLDMSKVIWNPSDTLFCDLYPLDPSCLKPDLYLKATSNMPADVGISPGVDLEWGSPTSFSFTGSCTASTVPASSGTGSWPGSKTEPSSGNSWVLEQKGVRVPFPAINLTPPSVTYKISCPTDTNDPTKVKTAEATVPVNIPGWTVTLKANGATGSTTISNGGSLTLVWSVSNDAPAGTVCSAPIWAPNQSGTNITTTMSNVTNSANYSVTCYPPGTSVTSTYAKTASVQVNVVKVTSFPQIGCFQIGSNPVLSWSSQNANSCSMSVPGNNTVPNLPTYSSGWTFTDGPGQYVLTCKDTSGVYSSGGYDSVNATQCIPNFSINSSMLCNGNPNGNNGIITDNSFQKVVFKSSTTYVAKIPVNITPQSGFTSDISYTFLKPATIPWSKISVKWASGATGNTVVKTNSGGYADTLILTASSLADMNDLFTGVANSYQGVTIQAQRVNSTPAQLKPNPPVYNFSVCAPGAGGVKPIFIES